MNKKLYATCGILLTVLLIALVSSYIPFFKTNEGFEEGVTNGNTSAQSATIGTTVMSPPLQQTTVSTPPLQQTTDSTQPTLIDYANRLKNRTNARYATLSNDDKQKFSNIIKDIYYITAKLNLELF
jgi:hypothetical protein